ncbi:XylR N-terminal domain-containing protein [Bradyrhizobium liaoningense]|uniref:XylR N-terminal domain-containing protein n=1 Tax=Bradyrhizobium liaoningense TaxID=43992 RepID=UPI001BAD1022|nr:XylR N-terminal domain-containing protein [Bradyrhizobium liaoningense]MBR0713577.1 XylR N-terminal domain-containing protein [Bradyrhizobium liaoningense]
MISKIEESSLLDRGGRPTLRDMLSQIVYDPAHAHISLRNARLVLHRASIAVQLQEELVRRFGPHDAQVILLRLGFQAGTQDAEFIRTSWPELDLGDAFTAGTRMHTMSGVVRVQTVYNDFDFKQNKFAAEFLWHGGMEATEFLNRQRNASEPVCWMQVGYASGYASYFFDKLIVYKETECAAMGHKHCRVTGRTADGWGADDPTVRMFREEVVPSLADLPRRSGRVGSTIRAPTRTTTKHVIANLEDVVLEPIRSQLDNVAAGGLPALIVGPHGCGKHLAARYLHQQRHGADGRLRRFVCRSLTSEQIDIWLRKLKQSRETWLLENIETLPEECQLLLAERVENQDLPPGLQLAGTSTHRLSELIAIPALRRDFLFALAVLPIELPGLQDRRGDIADIARAMLAGMKENDASPQYRLSRAALDALKAMALPGNLPQLRSVLLSASFNARLDGGNGLLREIQPKHLSRDLVTASPSSADTYVGGIVDQMAAKSLTINELSQRIYTEALRRSGGKISTAARMLGITRPQFVYRARGIDPGN